MFSFSFNTNYNKKYLKKNTINSFAKQKDYIPNKILLKDIFPKVNNNLLINNISFFDKIILDRYYKRDLFYEQENKKNNVKCQTSIIMFNKSTQTDNTNDSEDFILVN